MFKTLILTMLLGQFWPSLGTVIRRSFDQQEISRITITTGEEILAGTDGYVTATVYGRASANGVASQICTTDTLDNWGYDFERGHTDEYTGRATLGNCYNKNIGTPYKISLRMVSGDDSLIQSWADGWLTGGDGWYPTTVVVELTDGYKYSCRIDEWMNVESQKTCLLYTSPSPRAS